MKFIHVTDLHLMAPVATGAGAHKSQAVSDALDQIARNHGDADFCVITGDLADAGAPEAYRWLKDRLSAFPLRTFLLLGNHDDRGAFLQVFAGAGHDHDGFVQNSHETENSIFLFLDTHLPGAGGGTLCGARLAWLRGQIARAAGRAVYIFMHHPPLDIGDPNLDPIRLNNPDDFADALGKKSAIRHIFFGHIHRNLYARWRDVACTSMDPIRPDPACSEAKTGGSAFPYGIVTIRDDQLTLSFAPTAV